VCVCPHSVVIHVEFVFVGCVCVCVCPHSVVIHVEFVFVGCVCVCVCVCVSTFCGDSR